MISDNNKYHTEMSFNKFATNGLLIRSHEMEYYGDYTKENKEIIENSNIYLIVTRPRISFNPLHFEDDGKSLSGKLFWKIKGIEYNSDFKIEKQRLSNNYSLDYVVSEYPHTELLVKHEGQIKIRLALYSLFNLMNITSKDLLQLLNLNVLYVGQAFGKEGERNSFQRLQSHSTLQKILADSSHKNPDNEIYILFLVFSNSRLFLKLGNFENPNSIETENVDHVLNALDFQYNSKYSNSIVEASLIRYFRPLYNDTYKDSFPCTDHKILKELYELNIQSISIEICLDEYSFHLYSEKIKPFLYHNIIFNLTNDDTRRKFFTELT